MIAFARPPVDPDKEAFHRYLQDFRAVENEGKLLDLFITCDDILPPKYAELLFLPPASTYRDAVRLLLSSWNSPLGGAPDWLQSDDEPFADE